MKKKVLTIIPSLYGGGAEKFVADISNSLSKKYDHTILLYNKKKERYNFQSNIIDLNIPRKKGIVSRFFRQISVAKKINNVSKKIEPDITISHMLISNILNVLTNKNTKKVCFLHSEWCAKPSDNKLLNPFVKKIYAKANLIISVSHYIKNIFENEHGKGFNHEVIYIGINNEEIISKAKININLELPEKFLVLVAAFRPEKNHLKLIKQLKEFLLYSEYYLVLVGDGPLKKDIEKEIKLLGLTNKIILVGNIANPYPIIKKAHISLLVSSSESFSLVVVESMALGIPVIATDCGGPREIIDPNWENKKVLPYKTKFGYLINKTELWDNNSLITPIKELINNQDLYQEISSNSKNRAKEFDIRKTENKLINLLNNLD